MNQELFERGIAFVRELDSHIDELVSNDSMDSDEGMEHIEIITAIHDYLLRLFKH